MAGIFAFKCSACGEIHEGSPSYSYDAPLNYSQLSENEKESAKLSSDVCIITHEDGTDRFIRVVLEVPIHGVTEPFMWGVWVSLSQESLDRYLDTWDSPVETDSYFGWLCNRLPYYPDTMSLKTTVRPRKNGWRPCIELERDGQRPLAVRHQLLF